MVTHKTWNGRRIWGKAAWIASLFVVAIPVNAASQGNLGGTSTGSLDITLVINPMIQISQLQDIQLSTTQGEATEASTPLCVSGNYDGEFQLEAQGSGRGSEFELSSGEDSIDYQVILQTEAGGVALDSMIPSQSLPLGACETTDRTLVVGVSETETESVEPGVYNGTLTLVVSPI